MHSKPLNLLLIACAAFQVKSDEDSNQARLRQVESGEECVSDMAAMAAGTPGPWDIDPPRASDDPCSRPVLQEV